MKIATVCTLILALLFSNGNLFSYAEEQEVGASRISVVSTIKIPKINGGEGFSKCFLLGDRYILGYNEGKQGVSYHCFSSTGELLWKIPTSMSLLYQFSSVILIDNLFSGKTSRISTETGKVIWSREGLSRLLGAPTRAFHTKKGITFVDHQYFSIDIETGKEISRRKTELQGHILATLRDSDDLWLLTWSGVSKGKCTYDLRKRNLCSLEETLCVEICTGTPPDYSKYWSRHIRDEGCKLFNTGDSIIAFGFHGIMRFNKKSKKIEFSSETTCNLTAIPKPFVLGDSIVYQEFSKDTFKRISFVQGKKDELIDFRAEKIGVIKPWKLMFAMTGDWTADVYDLCKRELVKVGNLDLTKQKIYIPRFFLSVDRDKAAGLTFYDDLSRCILILKRSIIAEKNKEL